MPKSDHNSSTTARAASASSNGHRPDVEPRAGWWSMRQFTDNTGSIPDQPIRDNVGVVGWRELHTALGDRLGVEVAADTAFDDLAVLPADWCEKHAEMTLSRAEVAAYAAGHGLDDPHDIADRLAADRQLDTERERQRIQELFEGDPLPLRVRGLPPFPVHALPPVIADAAVGVARELGVDPAMTAVFGLGAVSAALTGRVVVQVRGNWVENGVSYLVVVAESGDRKSQALKDMFNTPFAAVERELSERCWNFDSVEFAETDMEAPDGSMLSVRKGEPEFDGPAPRIIASDITTEQLGVLMADNDERMVLADAEGDVFDYLAGRYTPDPSLNLFLQAYSRDPARVDRVGRDAVRLDHPALTLCLATQPPVWYDVMSKPRFAGKGFVARIEAAFPEPRLDRKKRIRQLPPEERREWSPVPVPPATAAAYHDMIVGLALEMHDRPGVTTAQLTPEAQTRMLRHSDKVDDRRTDGGDLGGKLSKWAAKSSGRVVRRALHLHMAEHRVHGAGRLIDVDTVKRAIDIEEWFVACAREAYGLANPNGEVTADDLAAFVDWLVREHRKTPYKPIRLNHIIQNAIPKNLRQKSRRDAAVELLVDLKYLVRVKVGKAAAVYLHPAADVG